MDWITHTGIDAVHAAFVYYYQGLLGTAVTVDPLSNIPEGPVLGLHQWDTLTAAIWEYFKKGRMSKQANSTLLALIPKKKVFSFVADFRFLLYNVLQDHCQDFGE